MDSEGQVKPEDLLVAAHFCQASLTDSPDVPTIKASLRDALWRRKMTRNPLLFRRECEKFAQWIEAHSTAPKFWTVISGGQNTRQLTGPNILILVANAIRRSTITLDQAWTMSLGQLQWIGAELDELEGSDRRFLFDGELEGGESC